MFRPTKWVVYLALSVLGQTTALSAPGESLIKDPHTGDYIITYLGDDGETGKDVWHRVIFVPATKIDPEVKSSFKWKDENHINYDYQIKNGKKSKQPLLAFRLDPVNNISSRQILPRQVKDIIPFDNSLRVASLNDLLTPSGWRGSINPSSTHIGLRISWSFFKASPEGLPPGDKEKGFGFSSADLPGIILAELKGAAPVSGYPDEGPQGEIGDQLYRLEINNFVPRPAAVPTIPVTSLLTPPGGDTAPGLPGQPPAPINAGGLSPQSAVLLLDMIRAEMSRWTGMKLIEPSLFTKLDQLVVSVTDALKLSDTQTAKNKLKDIQRLIKTLHADIDQESEGETDEEKPAALNKLAARVLNFNLKFVLKNLTTAAPPGVPAT